MCVLQSDQCVCVLQSDQHVCVCCSLTNVCVCVLQSDQCVCVLQSDQCVCVLQSDQHVCVCCRVAVPHGTAVGRQGGARAACHQQPHQVCGPGRKQRADMVHAGQVSPAVYCNGWMWLMGGEGAGLFDTFLIYHVMQWGGGGGPL